MKLNLDQIRDITFGCAEILEEDEKILFNRFTAAQSEAYRKFRGIEFQRKTFAAAGVRMAFKTDSSSIAFEYKFSYGSSRMYGWFDVYENGVIIDHFGGEGLLFNSGSAKIKLSEGLKSVEIHFPWSKAVAISDFILDDDSIIISDPRPKTMLSFGDSITQGYDAIFPSLTYASQLSRWLDCNLYNKAVAGDTFFPEMLYSPDDIKPDIITVSYGSNDWNFHNKERLIVSGYAFFEKLIQKYPGVKIFAFTPVWRGDGDRETPFGAPISEVGEVIRSFCEDLPVTVIDGYPLAPHCPDFYSDRYLHPNDTGFCIFANALYAEVKKYL
jgi:hypothetical protein